MHHREPLPFHEFNHYLLPLLDHAVHRYLLASDQHLPKVRENLHRLDHYIMT